MEELRQFIELAYKAPSLVWSLAILMSAISAYILHTYIDDYLYATISAFAMFVAIMVGHVAFTELGVFFTDDKESNIAASAGAAVCSVTLIAIILLRIWHATVSLRTRSIAGEDPA